jgi:hypothetical protein
MGWFFSKKDDEPSVATLKIEYEKLKNLYKNFWKNKSEFQLTNINEFIDVIVSVVQTDILKTELSEHWQDILADFAKTIIEQENIFKIEPIKFLNLSYADRLEIEEYLKAKKYFFDNFDTEIDKLFYAFIFLKVFFENLPISKAEDETLITINIIDIIRNLPAIIDKIFNNFLYSFKDEFKTSFLFWKTQLLLEKNKDEIIEITKKNNFSPQEHFKKIKQNKDEFINVFLKDTAIYSLFYSKIDITVPFQKRFEHTWLCAGSGHGKTQFLQLMIYKDLQRALNNECGLCVIDSQSQLINLLSRLKIFDPQAEKSLADKFILIDPEDIFFPPEINIFDVHFDENISPLTQRKVKNQVIECFEFIFKAIVNADLTAYQQNVFRFSAQLLMEIKGATIETLKELLNSSENFKQYYSRLDDYAKNFFLNDFDTDKYTQQKQQVASRLDNFFSLPDIRQIFFHKKNKINLYEAMKQGKIILINTSKSLLQDTGSSVLGQFFLMQIWLATIQRSEDKNPLPFFVYVDECHEYFNEKIAKFFQQARKRNVGVIIAHQGFDDLDNVRGLKSIITTNTTIKFGAKQGAKNNAGLAKELKCKPEELDNAKKHQDKGYTEFMCFIDGITPQAVKNTIPLGYVNRKEKMSEASYTILRELNRQKYCVGKKDQVEQELSEAEQRYADLEDDF